MGNDIEDVLAEIARFESSIEAAGTSIVSYSDNPQPEKEVSPVLP
jgi:hypothetical protein